MVHGNINKEGGTAQAVAVGRKKRSAKISDQFLKREKVRQLLYMYFVMIKTCSTDHDMMKGGDFA